MNKELIVEINQRKRVNGYLMGRLTVTAEAELKLMH